MAGTQRWCPECSVLDGGLTAYQSNWTRFSGVLQDISDKLAALPDGASWEIRTAPDAPLLGHVTADEFLGRFQAISWTLTNQSYSNGGVGEVVSNFQAVNGANVWRSAAEQINADNFDGYMAWPENKGSVYLALHETAHVTDLGIATWRTCYAMFEQENRGNPRADYNSSNYWTFNEGVANQIAKEVAAALNLGSIEQPTGGFPDSCLARALIPQLGTTIQT